MANQPAHNTLTITTDGILVLTQTGHQTAASVGIYQEKMDDLTDQYHKQGKKVLILVDVSGVTSHDPEARNEGRKRLNGNYDAMAICGNNTAIRLIINWLIKASGNSEKVQFFSTKDEAIDWLHSRPA